LVLILDCLDEQRRFPSLVSGIGSLRYVIPIELAAFDDTFVPLPPVSP